MKDKTTMSLIECLPSEVLSLVLENLECKHQRMLSALVCKQWLDIIHSIKTPKICDYGLCACAASKGYLKILQWVREHKYKCNLCRMYTFRVMCAKAKDTIKKLSKLDIKKKIFPKYLK